MSWLTRISPLPFETDLYIIRFLSVVCGVLTFIVFARLWQRLGLSVAMRNVTILVVTNLAMGLMLSGAINNDPCVWLFTGLSGLLALRLLETWRLTDALLLALIITYGGLVKRTFLPLALVFGLFLLVSIIRKWATVVQQLKKSRWREWLLVATILVGVGLVAERIGGNIVRYGSMVVSCQDVHGQEACSVFWAAARAEKLANNPDEVVLPLYQFVPAWLFASIENNLDIQTQGWRHEVRPPVWLVVVMIVVMAVATVYGIVHDWKRRRASKHAWYRLAFVGLGVYVFAYQLVVNYSTYQKWNVFGIALNGRYVLPGIILLAGLFVYYYAKALPRKLAILFAIVIAGLTLVYSGLFMMTQNPQLYGYEPLLRFIG